MDLPSRSNGVFNMSRIPTFILFLSGRSTVNQVHLLPVSLGPQISYRKAAALLRMLLPPMAGTTHTSTRSRVIAVGERIDEEIRRSIPRTANSISRRSRWSLASTELSSKVAVRQTAPVWRSSRGGSRRTLSPATVFAVVRNQDGRAKQGVQAPLRQRGRALETKLRVVSDGEDRMRSLLAKWFNANEQHILDCYHIARRFEGIGKGLVYLPHVADFKNRLSRHWHHLNRAKWKV